MTHNLLIETVQDVFVSVFFRTPNKIASPTKSQIIHTKFLQALKLPT